LLRLALEFASAKGARLTGLRLPQYQQEWFIISDALFGEIVLMLWLVIKDARPQPLDATQSAGARKLRRPELRLRLRDSNRTSHLTA
jgi:hypothetical protein